MQASTRNYGKWGVGSEMKWCVAKNRPKDSGWLEFDLLYPRFISRIVVTLTSVPDKKEQDMDFSQIYVSLDGREWKSFGVSYFFCIRPIKGYPNSVIGAIFACGIRKTRNLSSGIRNPEIWNQEYSSRNPESRVPLTKNPESSTCDPESTTWNSAENKAVLQLDSHTWDDLYFPRQ